MNSDRCERFFPTVVLISSQSRSIRRANSARMHLRFLLILLPLDIHSSGIQTHRWSWTFSVRSGTTEQHFSSLSQKQKARIRNPCPLLFRSAKALQSDLLQRRVRRLCTAGREVTDHTRLVGEESARSGGVRRNGVATDGITRQRNATADGGHRELVATLGAGSQNAVNQVSRT